MEKEDINVILEVKNRLKDSSNHNRLTTGMVRRISAQTFKLIPDKTIDSVFKICEELLEERSWALGVIAYDYAYKMRGQYKEETFFTFEKWLIKYVRNWGDCDDFCTHAFGELLSQFNNLYNRVIEWTNYEHFWVRRAAAVILIYPIKKEKLGKINPYIIVNKLLCDDHYLVLKGYGWMLKVLSLVKPEEVYQYLVCNKDKMPRISFRYAVEKFDKDKKAILMGM